MSFFGRIGQVWELVKTVERLLSLEQKHGEAIADIRGELAALDKRLDRLEAQFGTLPGDAKAAARAGAQEVMAGVIYDMGRRIGALEAAASVPRKRISKKAEDSKP